MIDVLRDAARLAFAAGRVYDVFITIEIEPAGVLVRGVREHDTVRRVVTWTQLEDNRNELAEMVADVAGQFPIRAEVA